MKRGLFVGREETMEIVVTNEMIASFGGEVIHPVLSTVSMVYYMEWVGRKIICPFLEEYEEGVGVSINVRHRAPAPVGKKVLFTAKATLVTPKKVVCSVVAGHDQSIVGEGEFVQAILPKDRIRKKIIEMA